MHTYSYFRSVSIVRDVIFGAVCRLEVDGMESPVAANGETWMPRCRSSGLMDGL